MSLILIAHVPIPGVGGNGGVSSAINCVGSTCTFVAWSANRFFGPNISDNLGNSYSSNIGASANTNWQVGMGYSLSPTTSSSQVFTATQGGSNSSSIAFGFNLVNSLVEATNALGFDTSGGFTIQTPSITPTTANNLAISIIAKNDPASILTIDSGFTIIDTVEPTGIGVTGQYGVVVAYKAQSTAAALSPTWTSDLAWVGGAVARTAVFGLSGNPFASPTSFGSVFG